MFGNLWYFALPLLAFCYWIYSYVKEKHQFWAIRGVTGPPPVWGIGNAYERSVNDLYQLEIDWMRKYGKLFGIYMSTVPALWVIDHEVIKQVLIKDFQYFTNRIQSPAHHELWDENMLFAENEQWRRVRTIASPSFTSGKLKSLLSVMNVCVGKLDRYLEQLIATENGIMDTKNTIKSFTMDVIALTSFAVDADVYNKQNDILKYGKQLFDIKLSRMLALWFLPKFLLNLLDIQTFLPPEAFNFFIKFTQHIVRNRKGNMKQFEGHNDLLQLLLEASVDEKELEETNYEKLAIDGEMDESKATTSSQAAPSATRKFLTENEVVANTLFFIVAGFETTASTLTHCIFELVRHEDIQERLHQKVTAALQNVEPNSSEYFEVINSAIPYLDAVIKETLRRYPPVTLLTRMCTNEDYRIKGIHIGKMMVGIPVSAVHHCEEYFPEPELFKPERFLPENKDKVIPYTFLPFGQGPRNCVGSRFAYQEIRLCLAIQIQKYRFESTPLTPTKLTFKKANSLLNSETFPVKVVLRT